MTVKREWLDVSERVRIWWQPTRHKSRTEYSGMYWPAEVLSKTRQGWRVQYDNGDSEIVQEENISPLSPPVEFGKEAEQLQEQEFCEVSNDSPTDPACWLARIKRVNKDSYLVSYPLHDTDDETVKQHLVRRAQVFDPITHEWRYIIPYQSWDDGDVSSPVELEQCYKEELKEMLSRKKALPVKVMPSKRKHTTPAAQPPGRRRKRKAIPHPSL